MSAPSPFNQAVSLHQAGQLAAAERLYAQVLATDHKNFSAQYQLAFLFYQQQRARDALNAAEAALALNPDAEDALLLHAVLLLGEGAFEKALASIERATALAPGDAQAWHTQGAILVGLRRFEAALESFDRSLAINPRAAAAQYHRGNILMELKRHAEAVAAFDAALALAPDLFDAWSNRGLALFEMERFADSAASYEKAAALRPEDAGVWINRGKALDRLERFDEALASFDKARGLAPRNTEAAYARALTLRTMHRLDEALAGIEEALAIERESRTLLMQRGWLQCELNRIADGLDEIARAADRSAPAAPSDHQRRHDAEQRAYLEGACPADGSRLSAPAVNTSNRATAAAQWNQSRPRIAVIDDLLTAPALEKLRRYCWAETFWRKSYNDGYLGATPAHGFASPLLAQVAEELRDCFPEIIGDHRLRMLWGFKYDSRLRGIGPHADQAAVNVNFWITPDEANLNPVGGGMIIWDVAAPEDWDVRTYNADAAAVRAFLKDSGAKPVKVPYRANRAVIFDSDLFHETDVIEFKEGYTNRRINITMLFGRRTHTGR